MSNYYLDLFEQYPEAEGIDFVSFLGFLSPGTPHEVIESYTKEDFNKPITIPKTPYLFWKMVDGKKVYL